MKKYIILLIVLAVFLPAQAYRPKPISSPYYFKSENEKYLIEVTPIVMMSRDSKYILVKKSQPISIYKKNKDRAWKEETSFRLNKMRLITEVLIPNHGKVLVIRVDENPMARNSNKDDGIYIVSNLGKILKTYSHFSVFKSPGIFRNMKLSIDHKKNDLLITNKEKVTRLTLPQ